MITLLAAALVATLVIFFMLFVTGLCISTQLLNNMRPSKPDDVKPTWVMLTLSPLEEAAGGGELVPLSLACHINPQVANVILYSNKPNGNLDDKFAEMIQEAQAQGVRFVERPISANGLVSHMIIFAVDLLLFIKLKPDIIHQHSVDSVFVVSKLAAYFAGVQALFTTFHRYPSLKIFRMPNQNKRRLSRETLRDGFGQWGCGFCSQHIDHRIFCLLESDSDAFHRELRLPHQKMRRIPNGISLEQFLPKVPTEKTKSFLVRRGIAVSSKTIVIGYVGRMLSLKGPMYLARALPIILRENIEVVVVFFGAEGSQSSLIRKHIEQLRSEFPDIDEKVYLAGSVRHEEIPLALASIDIYAMPSVVEAMPLGLIEAMAAGRAIVASRAGGIELMISHGETGLLFDPCDWQGLASNILKFARDQSLIARFGGAARDEAFRCYNVETMVERHVTEYLASFAK